MMIIFRWMSNKELLRDYTRMVIDQQWLQKMAQETKEGTPVQKHYAHQANKEKSRLELYEDELKKRHLLSTEFYKKPDSTEHYSDEAIGRLDSGSQKRDRGFISRTF